MGVLGAITYGQPNSLPRRESLGLKRSKAAALLPVFVIWKCLIPFASADSLGESLHVRLLLPRMRNGS